MSFQGARVLSFESRRAIEIAELIRTNGGDPFIAPALREVPLEQNEQAFRFADKLYADHFDMVIFLTGVGTRFLGKVLETREPADVFQSALRHVTVVARGPKPSAVLREWKVPVTISVPEPNTWRELLSAIENRREASVAVQEYGRPNLPLTEGLRAQGRRVETVPVYQWQLPADTSALSEALTLLLDGDFHVSMFTTGVQIDHFLEFAEQSGKRDEAATAVRKTFVASVGPDCSDALRSHGIEPDFEPVHPKMGFLVRESGQRWAETLVRQPTHSSGQ